MAAAGAHLSYWASSPVASDSSHAAFLRYYGGELGPLHGYHRSCGFSVRCVQASAATACRRNRKNGGKLPEWECSPPF